MKLRIERFTWHTWAAWATISIIAAVFMGWSIWQCFLLLIGVVLARVLCAFIESIEVEWYDPKDAK